MNKLLKKIGEGARSLQNRVCARPRARRVRRRGQALVEMALVGLLLGVLLAGAVDFGRAMYTQVVVTNMAGEGAAYAALYPDQDTTFSGCSTLPVLLRKSIQERVKRVAIERGLAIDSRDLEQVVTTIYVNGDTGDTACANRCTGNMITVKVVYTLHDLFIPGLLGQDSIVISKKASQRITRNPQKAHSCP